MSVLHASDGGMFIGHEVDFNLFKNVMNTGCQKKNVHKKIIYF